jgi:hypothetical protein
MEDDALKNSTCVEIWVNTNFLEELQYLADELHSGNFDELLRTALKEYYDRHEEL